MKTPAVILVVLIALSILTPALALTRTPLTEADVRRLETRLHLPRGAAPLGAYARWYTWGRVNSVDDLPFSTIYDGVAIRTDWPLIFGVFALKGGLWNTTETGAHIVQRADFPQFVHGGCDAINVVYDRVRRAVLGIWCNYDDRTPPPPPPSK